MTDFDTNSEPLHKKASSADQTIASRSWLANEPLAPASHQLQQVSLTNTRVL